MTEGAAYMVDVVLTSGTRARTEAHVIANRCVARSLTCFALPRPATLATGTHVMKNRILVELM